ncbi:hypothetical protein F4859DRAFT_30051 [Xylaria cf. heliscus]|nr:hypothetical protein F4859DRAFT_30051 [Xylaria cf. heliscus]
MKHLSIILALSVSYVRAQEFKQTIVGCAELECPPSSADTANDNCTVADNSFPYVGLTRIPTQKPDLKGKVSWTKGFNIADTPDNGRTFHSAFYFGTSPDLDLETTGACAVLLHGVETALSFGTDVPKETAQGTCFDAMGSDCVNALLDRARKVLDTFLFLNNTHSGDFLNNSRFGRVACATLQDDLSKNMDDACLPISKGSWTNLNSTVLSRKGAAQPISGDKNSSSTCWPVLPKENQLTLVSEYQTNSMRDRQHYSASRLF